MPNRRLRLPALSPIAALLACWWMLVFSPRLEAYIDPSAGGMLVQLILAGTAGVAVLAKLMWSRVRRAFGLKDSVPPESSDSTHPQPHDRV